MKIKKARIQPGFPKLAYWRQQQRNNYYPDKPQSYGNQFYRVNEGELIIVIASDGWNIYNFVPFELLQKEIIPLNAILTWTNSYSRFPRVESRNIELID